MRVYRPTDNPISRGYSLAHKGYDFRGLNRPNEVRAGQDGEVIERVDRYTSNWRNTGTLTTRDYGNYVKVKHSDGTFEFHAHLKKGSAFVVGTKVKAGQTIARIGNTGNSTGPHLHSEYRNTSNRNVPVEFYVEDNSEEDCQKEKDQLREQRDTNHNLLLAEKKSHEGTKGEVTKQRERAEGAESREAGLKAEVKELRSQLADKDEECVETVRLKELVLKAEQNSHEETKKLLGIHARTIIDKDTKIEEIRKQYLKVKKQLAESESGKKSPGFIKKLIEWLLH